MFGKRFTPLVRSLIMLTALIILGATGQSTAHAGTTSKAAYYAGVLNAVWGGYSINFTNPDPQNDPLAVSGSWTVPSVTCIVNGQKISGEVAVWPGLGGTGSNTLEQTGTTSQCSNGTASYWAWWETYPSKPPVNISTNGKDLVSPGDSMTGAVTEQGPGYFVMQLWDNTKKWYNVALWQAQYSSTTTPQTADWVVEDFNHATFPQFKSNIVFTSCTWVKDGSTKALISGKSLNNYTVVNAQGIGKENTGPVAANGSSFYVQWLRT